MVGCFAKIRHRFAIAPRLHTAATSTARWPRRDGYWSLDGKKEGKSLAILGTWLSVKLPETGDPDRRPKTENPLPKAGSPEVFEVECRSSDWRVGDAENKRGR